MPDKINDTLKNRGSIYGEFEDNADITQELIKVIENAPSYSKLSKQHLEAFHMIFHKISRAVCGDPDYIDNIHDIVGYAKLLEDFLILKKEKEEEWKTKFSHHDDFIDALKYSFIGVDLADLGSKHRTEPFKFPESPKSQHKDLGNCKCELKDPEFITDPKEAEEALKARKELKEKDEKVIADEVTMLTHAAQGKFGPRFECTASEEASKIFREKIKNGEI